MIRDVLQALGALWVVLFILGVLYSALTEAQTVTTEPDGTLMIYQPDGSITRCTTPTLHCI